MDGCSKIAVGEVDERTHSKVVNFEALPNLIMVNLCKPYKYLIETIEAVGVVIESDHYQSLMYND